MSRARSVELGESKHQVEDPGHNQTLVKDILISKQLTYGENNSEVTAFSGDTIAKDTTVENDTKQDDENASLGSRGDLFTFFTFHQTFSTTWYYIFNAVYELWPLKKAKQTIKDFFLEISL